MVISFLVWLNMAILQDYIFYSDSKLKSQSNIKIFSASIYYSSIISTFNSNVGVAVNAFSLPSSIAICLILNLSNCKNTLNFKCIKLSQENGKIIKYIRLSFILTYLICIFKLWMGFCLYMKTSRNP